MESNKELVRKAHIQNSFIAFMIWIIWLLVILTLQPAHKLATYLSNIYGYNLIYNGIEGAYLNIQGHNLLFEFNAWLQFATLPVFYFMVNIFTSLPNDRKNKIVEFIFAALGFVFWLILCIIIVICRIELYPNFIKYIAFMLIGIAFEYIPYKLFVYFVTKYRKKNREPDSK